VTAVPVAEVVRSGFVESIHFGSVVALDAGGVPVVSVGDVGAPMLPRSANKLVQAAAMVRAGLPLQAELLALAASSHSGEPFHLEGVRHILRGAGLDETALQNTPDLPYDAAERRLWVSEGAKPSALAQQCSGKHAAMLATCVINGWSTGDYLDPGHPVQQQIAAVLEELSGDRVSATVVDGCGAPAMAISLQGLARSFAALASADPGSSEGLVAGAVRNHPLFVAGTTRDVTRLMLAVPGLIAKDGAEAVYAAALPDGRAVAIKVSDGGRRAGAVTLVAGLRAVGVAADQVAFLAEPSVLAQGKPVGVVRAVAGWADSVSTTPR
jgi:L-asparaginase II